MMTDTMHDTLSGVMMTFYAMMPVAIAYLYFVS